MIELVQILKMTEVIGDRALEQWPMEQTYGGQVPSMDPGPRRNCVTQNANSFLYLGVLWRVRWRRKILVLRRQLSRHMRRKILDEDWCKTQNANAISVVGGPNQCEVPMDAKLFCEGGHEDPLVLKWLWTQKLFCGGGPASIKMTMVAKTNFAEEDMRTH